MSNETVFRGRTADGRPFEVDHISGRIRYEVSEGGRKYERERALPSGALLPLVLSWLYDYGTSASASMLAKGVLGSKHLLEMVRTEEWDRPTAELFAAYLKWLRARQLAESTRRGYAGAICEFLMWVFDETDLLMLDDVAEIESRFRQAFKGFGERERRRSQELAGCESSKELRRLYRAIALEVEESERVLKAGPAAQDAYDQVFPLLPFPLLLGMMEAMRSGEINGVRLCDVGNPRAHVRVHQPNKRPATLPMGLEVQRAWTLARCWQEHYRNDMDVADATALMYRTFRGHGSCSERLLQLDSIRLTYHLRRFYRKYFDLRDATGERVLYRVDGETGDAIPFDLPFSKYRHASITEFSRFERDPSKLRRFARHEWLKTTTNYYVRNTLEEVREAAITGLGPFSERVRLRVLARRATDEELESAQKESALVPGGACGEALQGIYGCRRATDCRLCSYFLIDPRKRDWFIEDSKRLNERADRIEREKGYVREVQNLRGMAALNDAIVQVIDESEMGFR